MTDIVERLEAFAARHYHVERGGMARDAAREIVKWKTAYQAAIKVGGEIEEQLKRMRDALEQIANPHHHQIEPDLIDIARRALEAKP